jgi:hypothetical protein
LRRLLADLPFCTVAKLLGAVPYVAPERGVTWQTSVGAKAELMSAGQASFQGGQAPPVG